MGTKLENIPRIEKRDIATQISNNLALRAQNGPAEPALDAYIVACKDVASALGTHVQGHAAADAERATKLFFLETVDANVDRYYRHIHDYIDNEARVAHSPNAGAARALLHIAFPDGLDRIDERIDDENRYCRKALEVLRSAENAPTVQAIGLPMAWLDAWENALTQSETTQLEVSQARVEKQQHIGAGKGAEEQWVKLMVRLRKYVQSRADSSDTEKVQEGKALLAPLLHAIAQQKANAARRATMREKGKEESTPEMTG